MRIVTWNCNGIRSRLNNGFWELIQDQGIDVFLLQEVKAPEVEVPIQFDAMTNGLGYFWNHNSQNPGMGGTAVFSNQNIVDQTEKYSSDKLRLSGRIQIIELQEFIIINAYSPQSGVGLVNLDEKKVFMKELEEISSKILEDNQSLIICGDLNVANRSFKDGNASMGKATPGFTEEEYLLLDELLELGFEDVLESRGFGANYEEYFDEMEIKHQHSWRLDHILVHESLSNQVRDTFTIPDSLGSDHYPIGLEIST